MYRENTKYGVGYEATHGLKEDYYYQIIYEFINLAKAKGLTVRQAQKLFIDCADMVLETKLSPKDQNINDVPSDLSRIAHSLEIMSHRIY